MANTYLTRTPSSTGNATKWTLSMWVKRSKLGVQTPIISTVQSSPSNTYDEMYFNTSDKFQFSTVYNNTQKAIRTTRVFRDVNAWYHIQFVYDTTNSTDTDHAILYINGVRETSFEDTTLLASGANDWESAWNKSGNPMRIGYQSTNTASYFDGSMSHIHFANNQTYAATVFGETDATTGEWKIKTSPSFTPGTNGFTILKDGNTITDQSTNSNNFSLGGGTLTKTEDNPSNNFATMNPLIAGTTNYTYSNGNNSVTQSGSSASWVKTVSTLGANSGKYYWEIKANNASIPQGFYLTLGVASDTNSVAPSGHPANGITYKNNGSVAINSNIVATISAYTNGDIISFYLDMDNGALYIAKNGVIQNSGVPTSGASKTGAFSLNVPNETHFACTSPYGSTANKVDVNFGNGYFGSTQISSAGTNASGNGIFEYNVPAGFTALSTKGLNL